MGFLNKAFSNVTAIPRKLKILPENFSSPQGALDLVRGKKKAKGKSVLGKPLGRASVLTGAIS